MGKTAVAKARAQKRNGKKPFFSADLPAGELERILARIEENLTFRQAIQPQAGKSGPDELGSSAPWVVGSGDARIRLERLRTSAGAAPLYTVTGGGRRNRIKQILNLPLKVFGRPQRRFNQETLGLLSELALTDSTLTKSLRELTEEVQGLNDRVEKTAELSPWLQSVAERLEGEENWLRSVAERQEDTLRAISAMSEALLGHEGVSLRKEQVTNAAELKAWYDRYFTEHKTWHTSDTYGDRIWAMIEAQWSPNVPRERFLDVACGGGHFLSRVQTKFKEIYGCDLSDVAVEEAKGRLNGHASIQQADAERLPYPDGYFDAITCLGSLEHFLNTEQAISEMVRVGRESALYAIVVPITLDWIIYDVQPTEVIMSPAGWKDILSQNGLDCLAEALTDDDEALKAHSPGHVCLVLRRSTQARK